MWMFINNHMLGTNIHEWLDVGCKCSWIIIWSWWWMQMFMNDHMMDANVC